MFKKNRPPVGARPGTLVAHEDALEPKITVIDYTHNTLEEAPLEVRELEKLERFKSTKSVTWIDVQGLSDIELLERLGQMFGIHALALEDVVNIPQRPKAEDFDESLLIITHMITAPTLPHINAEQLSIFIGPNYVITFQERYGDILERVRTRIRQGKGPIRKSGADYLGYALLDAVVDGYFPLLEGLGEYLEGLEERVISKPTEHTLKEIYEVRRELLKLRRLIFPQREILSTLIRDGSSLIKKSTYVYFRDCYDHAVQVIDVLETFREICGGLMDVYLSGISNKMNEVMKVLTIIATIFIPLSFLAGIYGMNFEYMPELKQDWAYPVFWITIITLGGGMLLYFKRLGWLGSPDPMQPADEDKE